MFMKPIPIGSSPRQKQPEEATANEGISTDTDADIDTGYELMLTDEAMQEWKDAEARDVAQTKARLLGTGMVGTLLDIKV